MLVCNPYEIVIHGTTSNGKTFRPSDWAERLCGILSSFDKGNRLSYHEWVRPMLVDKVRCVAVDKKLEEINPPMFRFLMDFAADNDLRVMDCKALMEEHDQTVGGQSAIEQVELAKVIEEKDSAKQTSAAECVAVSELREIRPEETAVAFAALSVLRPMLTDVSRFVEQVNGLQRNQGYRLLGVFEEGKTNAVAVCGFREETNLVGGHHIHIDDIVTIPQSRGKGYASQLLNKVQEIAHSINVQQVHIDSNVGSERADAHRLYFNNGFEICSYHFVCRVG